MKEKKSEKETAAPAPPPSEPPKEACVRLLLTRDEWYMMVNAVYHSAMELRKSGAFAIRNRGNAYGLVGMKIDNVYQELIEHGQDASFTLEFFENKKEEKRAA
jgi:hypothetical protein